MNNAFINTMLSVPAGQICNLLTLTTPAMNKKNNPYFGRVTKLMRQTAQWGYNYSNGVNNRLEKMGVEGAFTAQPLSWGEWVVANKVIEHKGEYYLRFYRTDNTPIEVAYLLDGRLATAEETKDILSFCKDKGESKAQAEAGLAEHQVKPMTIKVSSLVRVVANGTCVESADKLAELAKANATLAVR